MANILQLNTSQLQQTAKSWHSRNLKIVLTNGCYDLLHVGHLQTFEEAKKLGDILVVGVNSDRSIQELKGSSRPIIAESSRCKLVAALRPVDFVVLFDDFNAENLIGALRPHVYVKGGDYTLDRLPEKDTLLRLGIELHLVPLVNGFSTTEIIDKIRQG